MAELIQARIETSNQASAGLGQGGLKIAPPQERSKKYNKKQHKANKYEREREQNRASRRRSPIHIKPISPFTLRNPYLDSFSLRVSEMGTGGKLVLRRNRKKGFRSKEEGSDDSDEDYILEQDGGNNTSDSSEYATSFAGEDSDESFDFEAVSAGSQEEEEEVFGFKPRSVRRGQKKPSVKRARKRTRVSDDDVVDYAYDEEEFMANGIDRVDGWGRRAVRSNTNKSSSGCINKRLRNRTRTSVDYDDDDEDVDDDDDEEFTPDGIDIVDEEEDFQVREKGNPRKRFVRKSVSLKGQKRKRKSKSANKPSKKKRRTTKRNSVLRRPVNSDDDFIAENRTVKEKSKKKPGRRKKRSHLYSESEVVSSGSSDCEYTISEEEREVLREAGLFCGNLTTCLRSSSLSKRLHDDGTSNHHQQKKSPGRKGKEKVEDLQIDIGKQVCGICLSEEGKGTVRGTLNCCNHYFCFACILEWSKVESRCPLCKQRFSTISKPASSNLGIDLRSEVIRVAKRDQVYRPTEEEVRGYFDPYENVVCMECQQGGDDNLMLLCDICDSPAHTFCVGLGREVPEGNWYCEGCRAADQGCRAADHGSFNSLVQDPLFNHMPVTSNLSAGLSTREINIESSEGTCQNSVSVQFPSVSPGIGVVPSPRHALGGGGGFQATSQVTGAGASTLSGRRRIRLRVHRLLSSNRMNERAEIASRNDGELELGGETETTQQNALISESVRSCSAVAGYMAGDSISCPVKGEDSFDASVRHLSRQHINDGPSTATISGSAGEKLSAEHVEVNAISGLWQLHQCSSMRTNGTDANISHDTSPDEAHFHTATAAGEQEGAKQQLQPIVRHHLKRLSQHTEVDRGTFKDIARYSTHTVLAACGLDHNRSMAIPVQPPSRCPHVERQSEPINRMENCCSSCFSSFVSDVKLEKQCYYEIWTPTKLPCEKPFLMSRQHYSIAVNGLRPQPSNERMRTNWTPEVDRYFIDLMRDQVQMGNRIDDHLLSKKAWRHMTALFNAKFRFQYEVNVLKNRHKTLRNLYRVIRNLLEQRAFSWDETRQWKTRLQSLNSQASIECEDPVANVMELSQLSGNADITDPQDNNLIKMPSITCSISPCKETINGLPDIITATTSVANEKEHNINSVCCKCRHTQMHDNT
ncbi:hypothetical protein NE237_011476 [Protea cynaroides]|uniref:Uncharacterized protein n=1 Tax=Protea cynaroides TaxID=273540 RepID=A0A9Q0JYB1_9MAGN|nr:hypothetical protein NE237_011476 [Protea cynaroides]